MSSNCWTIAAKPDINLNTAFCTAASVAFPLSEMLRHMIDSTFGTCNLSTFDGPIFFSSAFHFLRLSNRSQTFIHYVCQPLIYSWARLLSPFENQFNSFKMSSSDSFSKASSPSDKILSYSFEVEGCCVSGIWCVSSFITSMSEFSSLSLSFSDNFRFT